LLVTVAVGAAMTEVDVTSYEPTRWAFRPGHRVFVFDHMDPIGQRW
jgi:hypothetical protein